MEQIVRVHQGAQERLVMEATRWRGGRAGGGRLWRPLRNRTHAERCRDAALELAGDLGMQELHGALVGFAAAWHVGPGKQTREALAASAIDWLSQHVGLDARLLEPTVRGPLRRLVCVGPTYEPAPQLRKPSSALEVACCDVLADAEQAEFGMTDGVWASLLLVAEWVVVTEGRKVEAYPDLAALDVPDDAEARKQGIAVDEAEKALRSRILHALRAEANRVAGAYRTRAAQERWGYQRKETAVGVTAAADAFEWGQDFWALLEGAREDAVRAMRRAEVAASPNTRAAWDGGKEAAWGSGMEAEL